jgi:hypothetical protein
VHASFTTPLPRWLLALGDDKNPAAERQIVHAIHATKCCPGLKHDSAHGLLALFAHHFVLSSQRTFVNGAPSLFRIRLNLVCADRKSGSREQWSMIGERRWIPRRIPLAVPGREYEVRPPPENPGAFAERTKLVLHRPQDVDAQCPIEARVRESICGDVANLEVCTLRQSEFAPRSGARAIALRDWSMPTSVAPVSRATHRPGPP